ncbi:hypothetical protein GCM10022395_02800 [Snuella lapsa]|uniref:Lipoprotein n=1 Tax=Snuella lapsa TaxID=870481 RepID=A0ABP6WRH0_9FLAO
MKILKKTIYFLIVFIFLSCSSNDDDTITDNGFKVNGKFYRTDFATSSCCFRYVLIFSSHENQDIGQIGRFDLISPTDLPLTPGTYTFENKGIYDHNPVEFYDTTLENWGLAYSIYGGNGIKSGVVTVHSIINDGNQITKINLDYKFVWDDRTVIGHYDGIVNPN